MITTRILALSAAVGLCFFKATPSWAEDPLSLQIDPSRSHVVAITRRGGLLGFLGHEHAVLTRRWTTRFILDRGHPSRSKAEITVPLAALEIDTAEARKLAGLESGAPDPEDVAKIQRKMLGPEVLDMERFPQLSFEATSVDAKEKGRLEIKGRLTLHGVTREIALSATIQGGPDETLVLDGSFPLRLSEYKIEPPSTAGVGVRDEIEIRFVFRTRPQTAIAQRPPSFSRVPRADVNRRKQASELSGRDLDATTSNEGTPKRYFLATASISSGVTARYQDSIA